MCVGRQYPSTLKHLFEKSLHIRLDLPLKKSESQRERTRERQRERESEKERGRVCVCERELRERVMREGKNMSTPVRWALSLSDLYLQVLRLQD